MHNLFFAAVPPQDIADRIAEVWRIAGTDDRLRCATLHMTVLHLGAMGGLEGWLVQQASQAAQAVRSGAFTVAFDRVMTFRRAAGLRPIVLASDGANAPCLALASELYTNVCEAGIGLPGFRNLMPHVTLAYGAGFVGIRPLADPILWQIDEITLIDSLQGKGVHVPLGKWRLG